MANVKLTPEELKGQARDLALLKADYETLFAEVTSILRDTNSNWSEVLAHNFASKILLSQKRFTGVVEALSNGAEAAGLSADSIETIDHSLAKVIGGSDDGYLHTSISTASSVSVEEDAHKEVIDGIKDIVSVIDDLFGTEGFETVGVSIGFINYLRKILVETVGTGHPEGDTILDTLLEGLSLIGKVADNDTISIGGKLLKTVRKWQESIPDSLKWYDQLLNMDEFITSAGEVGAKIGSVLNMVEKNIAGVIKKQKALAAVITGATMISHVVGDIAKGFEDGRYSPEEMAYTLLDVGAAGGAVLVRGMTLGIVDIDTKSAVAAYQNTSEAFSNWVSKANMPLWAECYVDVLASPWVALYTTRQIIGDAVIKRRQQAIEVCKSIINAF